MKNTKLNFTVKSKVIYPVVRLQKSMFLLVHRFCCIQVRQRRQCSTKGVAYATRSGGKLYIAFQYKSSIIFLFSDFFHLRIFVLRSDPRFCSEGPEIRLAAEQ
jgi:hypothetical protein